MMFPNMMWLSSILLFVALSSQEEIPSTHVPTLMSTAIAVEVTAGEPVTFPCDVDSLGDFVLLWKRGKNRILFAGDLRITHDERLKTEGTSLHISSVNSKDSGEYTCQISTNPPIELAHSLNVLSSVNPSASLVDVTQTDESACYNFTVGNPAEMEFYSPNYPNAYPSNMKCTRRIEAEPGHFVMLEFRDRFQLENSATCEYDKLEVRDGGYGYSRLIGTFCDHVPPWALVSTGRYMWLQFTSDSGITNKGFRVKYTFVPMHYYNQDEE